MKVFSCPSRYRIILCAIIAFISYVLYTGQDAVFLAVLLYFFYYFFAILLYQLIFCLPTPYWRSAIILASGGTLLHYLPVSSLLRLMTVVVMPAITFVIFLYYRKASRQQSWKMSLGVGFVELFPVAISLVVLVFLLYIMKGVHI